MKHSIYTSLIASTLLMSGCASMSAIDRGSTGGTVAASESSPTFVVTEADIQAAGADAPQLNANNRNRGGGGHSKGGFMDKYDTDGDGTVSKAEFMAERNAGYDRRDSDGDGVLYQEEYVAEYEARLLKQLEEQRERQIKAANFRFTVMDKDDDELMSRAEFHDSGNRMFDRLDSDKNGVVDDNDTAERF